MTSKLEVQIRSGGSPSEDLPVQISYEIIRLFSEGLYQSPHKAIEELVSNGYDAGANNVYVISPRTDLPPSSPLDSLWVIDDGSGMDAEGFRRLWLVAESTKTIVEVAPGRLPIGQFGIGKLAAYVLAWRLTHISKHQSKYYYTSMDFHQVLGRRQNDQDSPPVTVGLHEVDEEAARALLSEVEDRDASAWKRLFGLKASASWTAAALSDFKDLFGKFRPGMLSWVLRTGLPLVSDFDVYLDGTKLEPSKQEIKILLELPVGGDNDEHASRMGLETTPTGVVIPGIDGEIKVAIQVGRRARGGAVRRVLVDLVFGFLGVRPGGAVT